MVATGAYLDNRALFGKIKLVGEIGATSWTFLLALAVVFCTGAFIEGRRRV